MKLGFFTLSFIVTGLLAGVVACSSSDGATAPGDSSDLVTNFTVGGTIVGLEGKGLVLANGADRVTVPPGATTFTLPTAVGAGASFEVTIASQPAEPPQTCSVVGGAGTVVSGDVKSIVVNCTTDAFVVGGAVTGLTGSGLVLQNGSDELAVNADGTFAFPTAVKSGAPYAVKVKTAPTDLVCGVADGKGIVGRENVTAVKVTCVNGAFRANGVGNTGSLQTFTVPEDGTYRIEAWGAQGGSATPAHRGGLGARMRGDFELKKGTVLTILVGQKGVATEYSGGGGGGSFVADGTTPVLVAGGGGGLRHEAEMDGLGGLTTEDGGASTEDEPSGTATFAGGKGGLGGPAATGDSFGSGGGGFTGDGEDDGDNGTGGAAFLNGGVGGKGQQPDDSAFGGYGGGGAGNGSDGGGGGGGYSGGAGGWVAGGGGSYNHGANVSNEGGVREGDGLIVITNVP